MGTIYAQRFGVHSHPFDGHAQWHIIFLDTSEVAIRGLELARPRRSEVVFFLHFTHERVPWHSRCVVTMETLRIEVRELSFHGHVAWHSNCVNTIEVAV